MERIARTTGSGFSFDDESGDTGSGGAIDPASIDGSGGGSGGGSFGSRSAEQFDPAIHVAPDKRNKDGSYTRKRGRKAGTSGSQNYSKKTADLNASIEQLSKVILFAHTGLAVATRCPEFELDKEESDYLAKASANVLEQFDIAPDPKTQAIAGLIIALGTVYAPRYIMISTRVKAEKKAKQENKATVYNANGSYAGETSFTDVTGKEYVEPAGAGGT